MKMINNQAKNSLLSKEKVIYLRSIKTHKGRIKIIMLINNIQIS